MPRLRKNDCQKVRLSGFISPIGLSVGMPGFLTETLVLPRAPFAPKPRPPWGDTPHWKNVAAPRSSSPHRGNKTLLKPLCRCGLRSPAREIETFSARVAGGTPASCRGSPFCFLPAPPRACVTTRTEKLGDQLPRGSAAWGEEGDKGGCSAPAGLVGLNRRAHTGSVEGSRKRGIILF